MSLVSHLWRIPKRSIPPRLSPSQPGKRGGSSPQTAQPALPEWRRPGDLPPPHSNGPTGAGSEELGGESRCDWAETQIKGHEAREIPLLIPGSFFLTRPFVCKDTQSQLPKKSFHLKWKVHFNSKLSLQERTEITELEGGVKRANKPSQGHTWCGCKRHRENICAAILKPEKQYSPNRPQQNEWSDAAQTTRIMLPRKHIPAFYEKGHIDLLHFLL